MEHREQFGHAAHKTLLLVDDSDDMHFLFTEANESCGAGDAVEWLHDGSELIHYLEDCDQGKKPEPGVIVLDLKMPKMSGNEALALLKARPEWSKIPVIVLSNSVLRSEIDSVKAAGAQFFGKPGSLEEFSDIFSVIRKVMH